MERLTVRTSMGVAVLKTPYRCERCGEVIYRLADQGSGEPIEKLAQYEDLEEQGKLLKLPCAVGDVVYAVRFGSVEAHKITSVEIEESGVYFKSNKFDKLLPFCEIEYFGKTVFLTQEEAEAALKAMSERQS